MTAALNRAAGALVTKAPSTGPDLYEHEATWAAKIALSAALTDPDDPDWLAKEIADAVTPDGMDSEELHGECDRPGGCYYHRIAAAVRAAILGSAS